MTDAIVLVSTLVTVPALAYGVSKVIDRFFGKD